MKKIKFLIILILGFFSLCFADESITITTYYPSPYGSYRQLTADQIAIGSTYRDPTYADGSLYVQGNVGIGTTSPQTPAPNALAGNLDVNDIYLRSTSRWASTLVKTFDVIGANSVQSCDVQCQGRGMYCLAAFLKDLNFAATGANVLRGIVGCSYGPVGSGYANDCICFK